MSLWKLQMVSALLSLSSLYEILCGEKTERNEKISQYFPGGLNIEPHIFLDANYEITTVIVMPTTPPPPPTSTSTTAASPTATCNSALPVIQNGGFESGSLSPWVYQSQVGRSGYSIVSPGSSIYGGNYAYAADLISPNYPYAGTVSESLSQTLNTCPGTNYSVSVDYKVGSNSGGSCKVNLPLGLPTVNNPGSGWQRVSGFFTASSTNTIAGFTFSCSTPSTWYVDNINVTATR